MLLPHNLYEIKVGDEEKPRGGMNGWMDSAVIEMYELQKRNLTS